MDSLTKNIIEFADVLRIAGVRLSTSEVIDSITSLRYIDILDKKSVKTALSSCMAKGEEERNIFSEAFDKFFIPLDERLQYLESKSAKIEEIRAQITQEAAELKFNGAPINLPDELKEVYYNLPMEEKHSIKAFIEKSFSGMEGLAGPRLLMENMVKGKLNNLRQNLSSDDYKDWKSYENALSDAGLIAGEVIEDIQNKDSLLYKNIGDIKEEEIPKVIMLIKQIAEKLRRNIRRRELMVKRKSKPDLRRTIRDSLSTGGVLFNIKYKAKSRKKNKLLVLCDVSASMYRFSGFAMQFILGMHMNSSIADTYIFSEFAEHINITAAENPNSFERKIKESKAWRKGTNIYNALDYILNSRFVRLNSSTIVIILSDAKTLDAANASDSLKLLDGKVKRIIWLNPLSEKEWSKIPSLVNFIRYSTMLDCSNIERLAKACSMI
ncbi:VWA domain containing CoxE-like protein [Oxobacter pfennigii]|uniref:VWA domain containing CoxE-like protein n=1 Tax=Oxobacter pfennigii TaxID=36849 RepID=A0A0P8W6X0_9CLOT|nr:VWA domain-containing protein [Oxobacter pfennigii]KPU43806.1 VWA domain containing CoxE-like protein [Oxobacter pfennigii]